MNFPGWNPVTFKDGVKDKRLSIIYPRRYAFHCSSSEHWTCWSSQNVNIIHYSPLLLQPTWNQIRIICTNQVVFRTLNFQNKIFADCFVSLTHHGALRTGRGRFGFRTFPDFRPAKIPPASSIVGEAYRALIERLFEFWNDPGRRSAPAPTCFWRRANTGEHSLGTRPIYAKFQSPTQGTTLQAAPQDFHFRTLLSHVQVPSSILPQARDRWWLYHHLPPNAYSFIRSSGIVLKANFMSSTAGPERVWDCLPGLTSTLLMSLNEETRTRDTSYRGVPIQVF